MSKMKDLLDKYFRLFVLAAVVLVVVYFIARNVSMFGNILLALIGFGMVVLVHEFGHFIVAKLSDIKVEAFSIGFSPVLAGILRTEKGYRVRVLPGFLPVEEGDESDGSLFSFTIGKSKKAGETEYRIGLIPFGGFVKMLGQEDTKEVEDSNDPRSYANKPVSVRMAVIAAGVVFNAVSAIVVFMIVFLIGINQMPPVVGSVRLDSPAQRAGLKAGDEIIEIAGKSDNLTFRNIGMAAALSGKDEEIELKVSRRDGTIKDFAIVAEEMESTAGMMRLFGIMPAESLTIARVDDAGELFQKTSLKSGDRIRAAGGRDVDNYWEFEQIIEDSLVPSVAVLAERVQKDGDKQMIEAKIALSLTPAEKAVKSELELSHICSIVPRLRVDMVEPDIELQRGDIILAAGAVENPTYKELRDVTEAYEDKELMLKLLRADADGIEKTIEVVAVPYRAADANRVVIGIGVVLDAEHPVVAKTIDAEGGQESLAIPRGAAITAVDGVEAADFYDVIRQIERNAGQRITVDYRLNDEVAGDVVLDLRTKSNVISVRSIPAEPIPFKLLERLYKASGPIEAVAMGYKTTVMFIGNAYMTLRRWVGGLVSSKNFMGPVGIAKVSYDIVRDHPLIYYVHFLGLISAFIAVFNSLPILPFDGGHIVFLAVEKVKGSPVNQKVQEVILYVGLALVLMFALYVTFNDIVRSFIR